MKLELVIIIYIFRALLRSIDTFLSATCLSLYRINVV